MNVIQGRSMKTKVSGAELEILEYLWKVREACTFAALLYHFNTVKNKQWCRQTLNTCLLRLKKRGLLQQDKIGTKSFYTPTLTRVEYEQKCAEEILQEAYGGTLANFIAALTGKDSITEIDKDELLDYILSRK